MTQTADPAGAVAETVSITLPRKGADDIVSYSPKLATRLHQLLARNTNVDLNATERDELEALAELAQVKQLLAMSLAAKASA